MLKKNEKIINKKGHIHGVPDLLVDILSDGNEEHDLVRKKGLYERFGVKEYWVVDPESKVATVFSPSSGKYTVVSEQPGKIVSPILNTEFEF